MVIEKIEDNAEVVKEDVPEETKEVVLKNKVAGEVVKEDVCEKAKEVVVEKVKLSIKELSWDRSNTKADNYRMCTHPHECGRGVIIQDLRRVKAELSKEKPGQRRADTDPQEELHKIWLEWAVEHLQRKELEQKKVNNVSIEVSREKAKEVGS